MMTDKEVHHYKTEYVDKQKARIIFSEQDYGQYGISTYIEVADDTSEKALETFSKLTGGLSEDAKKSSSRRRNERASRAVEVG